MSNIRFPFYLEVALVFLGLQVFHALLYEGAWLRHWIRVYLDISFIVLNRSMKIVEPISQCVPALNSQVMHTNRHDKSH